MLWLTDFPEPARTCGFTKAAESRHITSPAFGRGITLPEEWVGVRLVEWKNRSN
ncbi:MULTISPECIES: LysR family transcriptional regulator [Bartonella]|uniref:helix-turn-helix domain-containing protein n=1 Tax=Bartonella TaxID=773 RepID=UPI0018DDE8FB|nr:LysR family transcriptional regulator [Bartonella choladocola]MBI0014371.1 LysR family transcriptional regulator [Bartonella sp. B10834G3]